MDSCFPPAALPMSGLGGSGTTTIDTRAVPPDKATPEADFRPVTPGYFKAIGRALVRGRFFTEDDSAYSATVAIIDDTLARTYFPNEDPVGQRLHLGGRTSKHPWMTIVSGVAHVRYRSLESPSRVQVYWPEAQRPYNTLSLAIRTLVSPLSLAPAVEKQILDVDPNQPVYQVRSLQELRAQWLSRRFLSLLLVGLFALLALILAAVGIYGVMAHTVTRRTHEIGIRMAPGAQRLNVMRMILAEGLLLAVLGLGSGAMAALALTRLISSMLYGVGTTDPIAFVASSLVTRAYDRRSRVENERECWGTHSRPPLPQAAATCSPQSPVHRQRTAR